MQVFIKIPCHAYVFPFLIRLLFFNKLVHFVIKGNDLYVINKKNKYYNVEVPVPFCGVQNESLFA